MFSLIKKMESINLNEKEELYEKQKKLLLKIMDILFNRSKDLRKIE